MKKLLFILLGLTSLNISVANPTYDATRGALQNDSSLCHTAIILTVAHLVTANKDNLRKLSTSMFLQNTVHGQSTLKQVYLVGRSRWIHMQLQKNKPLKPVNMVGKINRVKFWFGLGIVVSPLLKEKMENFFMAQHLQGWPKQRL